MGRTAERCLYLHFRCSDCGFIWNVTPPKVNQQNTYSKSKWRKPTDCPHCLSMRLRQIACADAGTECVTNEVPPPRDYKRRLNGRVR